VKGCEGFKRFIDVLRGRIREYLPSEDVLGERSEGHARWINVSIGESELIMVYRETDTVKEFMIRSEVTDSAIVGSLERIGLKDVASIMAKWGYVPRSVTVSYVVPSKALYLLIEGVRGRVPTVRVSVRGNSYEASASYCVISESENVCAYLRELITVLSELRECVITYTL